VLRCRFQLKGEGIHIEVNIEEKIEGNEGRQVLLWSRWLSNTSGWPSQSSNMTNDLLTIKMDELSFIAGMMPTNASDWCIESISMKGVYHTRMILDPSARLIYPLKTIAPKWYNHDRRRYSRCNLYWIVATNKFKSSHPITAMRHVTVNNASINLRPVHNTVNKPCISPFIKSTTFLRNLWRQNHAVNLLKYTYLNDVKK
jgi:hypothetical protein